jgi:hypothetical protein
MTHPIKKNCTQGNCYTKEKRKGKAGNLIIIQKARENNI